MNCAGDMPPPDGGPGTPERRVPPSPDPSPPAAPSDPASPSNPAAPSGSATSSAAAPQASAPGGPGRPSAAQPEPPLRVTTLELFFDLVFAFTLTQLTALLVHQLSVAGGVQ